LSSDFCIADAKFLQAGCLVVWPVFPNVLFPKQHPLSRDEIGAAHKAVRPVLPAGSRRTRP